MNERESYAEIMAYIAQAEADRKLCYDNVDEADPVDLLIKSVADVERGALEKMKAWVQRDSEAMDLKIYYADRRLKDLNLDQPYDFESSNDLNEFGKLPGGGEIDF